MSAARAHWRGRLVVWLLAVLAVAGLAQANWRLVRAAVTSEPSCVAHVAPGEGNARLGLYSAAESPCSPERRTRR